MVKLTKIFEQTSNFAETRTISIFIIIFGMNVWWSFHPIWENITSARFSLASKIKSFIKRMFKNWCVRYNLETSVTSNADQTPKDQFLVSRNFVRDSFQEPFTLITTPDFIDSLLVFWTLAIAQTRAGGTQKCFIQGRLRAEV